MVVSPVCIRARAQLTLTRRIYGVIADGQLNRVGLFIVGRITIGCGFLVAIVLGTNVTIAKSDCLLALRARIIWRLRPC